MSYKIQTFSVNGLMVPQTSEKFVVNLTGFVNFPIRVFSTTLPKLTRAETSISVSGQPLFLPSKLQVPGEWQCSIYETMLQDASFSIEVIRSMVVTGPNGSPERHKFANISVFLTDQYTGSVPVYIATLKGAWLKSVSEVSLDWSKPTSNVVYNLRFRYSYIDTVIPTPKYSV